MEAYEPRYTTDYYSMEPTDKGTFFRMLYSGVRLCETAGRIAAERGDVSPTTVDREEEEAVAGQDEVSSRFAKRIGGALDDSSQLTQVRSNVDPPGGAVKGSELEESPEPYEEEGTDERVEELSVRASQEDEENEEDEKLYLVLGELDKITNMLDKGYRARAANESHNQLNSSTCVCKE